MSTQYPLQIIKENGNRVLRSPLIGNEEDRSLTLAAGVKEGDQFRFSMSPGFNVIDQTIEEFAAFRDNFPETDALIEVRSLPNGLMASKSGMLQLFQNLIGNAIKFRGDKQPHISISAQQENTQ